MSEINPDFCFPSTSPASLKPPPSSIDVPCGSAPTPLHGFSFRDEIGDAGAPGYSPQLRKKHRHRRSAAMSEDLSAVELASLLTPQIPAAASFSSSPVSTTSSSSRYMNMPMTPIFRPDESPRPASVQFVMPSSPQPSSPRRQLGEPGQLSTNSLSPKATPVQLKPAPASSSSSATGTAVRSASTSVPSGTKNSPKLEAEKRRKRRSFVNLFRRSVDLKKLSPPQSPEDPDATVLPVSPTITEASAESPFVTPRNSVDVPKPTIDLEEALNCSFDHRELDSPFSKSSKTMGAVLEDDGENDSESSESSWRHDSLRLPPSRSSSKDSSPSPRGRSPIMKSRGQRTISYVGPVANLGPPSIPISSRSGSPLRDHRAASRPSSHPSSHPSSQFSSQLSNQLSSQPSSQHGIHSSSQQKSFNFEQVSNLAISEPPKKHTRRRSLIDRIIRR